MSRVAGDHWLSIAEAARRLGVVRNTVYAWIAKGQRPDGQPFRAKLVAGRSVVRASDCLDWQPSP